MAKLNCHYADFVLKKLFFFYLQTVVRLNVIVEIVILFFKRNFGLLL